MSERTKSALEDKIKELEVELQKKQAHLLRYQEEIHGLNQQLRELIGQINQELKIAHLIQRALVPTEFPNIPGFDFSTKYLASAVSGGDYYDIFESEDRFRFGMLLSSSSGHGMSALFLSVLMRLAGQIESRRKKPANEVIRSMAAELRNNMQEDDFANVFYGSVDRRTLELNYSNVGINPVFHLAHLDGAISLLENVDDPITSKFDMKSIPNKVLSLNPRDRLVFCSFGVVGAVNSADEMFGAERISDIIAGNVKKSPHELRNEILFQVQKFTQKEDPDRDRTVIIAEVKDRVLKLAKG
jgi:phosphoserine phosphatase RsbU/P